MEYLVPVLTTLSIITSLVTLATVVKSRDKELVERTTRQNTLDNAIKDLQEKVEALIVSVNLQGEKITKLQMDFALLFQQHKANHK